MLLEVTPLVNHSLLQNFGLESEFVWCTCCYCSPDLLVDRVKVRAVIGGDRSVSMNPAYLDEKTHQSDEPTCAGSTESCWKTKTFPETRRTVGEVVVAELHRMMVAVYFYSEFYSCANFFYTKISAILFTLQLPLWHAAAFTILQQS